MDQERANRLIGEYAEYVARDMAAVPQGDGFSIVTPMINRHNDNMVIHIVEESPGLYILTDLGDTMGDLEMDGFSWNGKRLEKVQSTLDGFGMSRHEQEIYAKASDSELAGKMHMMMQAMAEVDDMYMLSKGSVRDIFKDDVGDWMLEHDINVVDGPSFTGRSGFPCHFAYAIGRSRRSPMRLIQTVANPSRRSVKNALFSWEDVKDSRVEAKGYVFLNAADGRVDEDVIGACTAYSVTPVLFGIDEDSHVSDLAA